MGSECSVRRIFIFLRKKIGFTPEPDIMLSHVLLGSESTSEIPQHSPYYLVKFLLNVTSLSADFS